MIPVRPVHLLRLGVPAALVAATLVTITGSSGNAAQPQPGPYAVKPNFARTAKPAKDAYTPNTVLVKFKKTASAAAKSKALGKVNSRSSAAVGSGIVAVKSELAAPDMLKTLKADASVEKASLDYIRTASSAPNDTYYGSDQAGALGAIRMPQAWDLTKTAGAQTVAVLDTGIDAGHPDLAGRVLAGYNEIRPGTSPNDDNGHGTMTAGIIGANTNNGAGVAGVAWNVKILPVKVLDSSGSGPDSGIIAGINWAASNGAKVINMSLGGDGDDSLLHDAVKSAVAKGVVVVAAAGNTGVNVPHFPASYPEVLSVAATDNNGALTSFSTQGDWVDIAAPGWNIISTGPRSLTPAGYLPYWTGSGTSFSAPMVAGVAALVRNKYPTYTPAQVMARLKSTARDAGPRGLDPFYGAGILDAYNALGGSWAPEFWSAGPDGNDVPARATAITGSSVTGTTGPEGDVDWYKITSTTAHSVVVNVTSPVYDFENRAQNFAPVVKVYDKDLQQIGGAEINYEPDTPVALTASVNVNLVVGDNYISVRNYNGSRDSRAYTVSYAASSAGAAPFDHAWVQNSSVADYSNGVAQTVKPVITSATDLSPASVIDSTVRLLNGKTGAVVPSTVDYAADTKQITITPTAELLDNTPYRISVDGVQETSGATVSSFTSVFRTVDQAPAPLSAFDATGGYTTAALSWTLPGITDLDQVVVRGAAGTTPPASPTAGTAYAPGATTSGTATGLANATSYAFSAWVKDRSGKLSATPATTQLIGTATSLTSASASIVNFGGSVTLNGKASRIDTKAPLAGVPLSLYGRNKNSTVWREIARRTTAADGTASVVYAPSVSTVFAWGYNGSADLLGSRTGNFTVEVRPTIASYVSPTAIKLGASTNFYGYVRPQHAGSLVYLQRLSGSTWSTITSTKLNSTGNYAFGIKPTAKGTYTYRVVFVADADHATAVSASKTFTVS
ncbi:S8 family serine peptidase [Kribbella voronezhensis]|uniref:S8 family serine peptidase n=1 Tax=Kribbella voronezhensis TaxID=2512212 RepID=UPI001EDD6B67|nr:S8 family serine peptidase [Kribbella voronezhensis]